ncbi:potassium-transporting ATPase subunit C [Actinomycetospora atypica]|uniref:Potassium-transporting ATPase KdpC subunit n=1 Tax=Actinomycetospora atypica TaxID=1290095 RepID=A0ABV9YUU7_9PSEU
MSTTLDEEPTDTPATPVLRGLLRQLGPALRLMLVATVVLGVVYPAVVWGVSRLPGLHERAEGSVTAGGASSLIGIDPVPADPAADPWFHLRPSASAPDTATAGLGPADPSTSGGSNLATTADDLVTAVAERRAAIAGREQVAPGRVPDDAVTASGSGLDPDISPAYADLQVPRVARVTGLGEDRVRALVAEATRGRVLGVLGEPTVNVPELDAALAATRPGLR